MSGILGDQARLEALAWSELMDSEPEEVFDRLTRLASKLLGAPVATMTLVDRDRQYFKSAVGTAVTQTPLSHSFCQHVVTDANVGQLQTIANQGLTAVVSGLVHNQPKPASQAR